MSQLTKSNSKSSNCGFTLIELMVTLTIAAVLAGFAAPSFLQAYRRSEARSLSDDFMMGLLYTKGQAISLNRCVTMCMSNNATTDSPTCRTSGGRWDQGWIIFANPDCNDLPSGDAELLQIYAGTNNAGPQIVQTQGSNSWRARFGPRGQSEISTARAWAISPEGASSNPTSVVCLSNGGRVNRYVSSVVGSNCE